MITSGFAENCAHPEPSVAEKQTARASGLTVIDTVKPPGVSADSGQFSACTPGAMFGLSAGENCPRLHQPDYYFPEKLIPID